MASYFHKTLFKKLKALSIAPKDNKEFSKWVEGKALVDFVERNRGQEELVILASSTHTFIHTVLVPTANLQPLDKEDLLDWSFNPYTARASIWYGGPDQTTGISYQIDGYAGSKTLDGGNLIIFGRTFEGMPKGQSSYFEILQELSHIAGIHWRPERRAYCKFDRNGDFEDVMSVTDTDDGRLVTMKQDALREYLIAGEFSLVQMFDFSLYQTDAFPGWTGLEDRQSTEDDLLFYRQRIRVGSCGYIRGIQVFTPSHTRDDLFKDWSNPNPSVDKEYVEFIAHDWRNKEVRKISTDPAATTNYFGAEDNDLPFELSPAFFRPEVLLKYKSDTDKYTVGDRDIHCRAAWYLKGYHINEAGQIHAYICDLRKLPYEEQVYWKGFNEEPKANISEQAFTNDFKGEFWSSPNPFQKMKEKLRELKVDWWALQNEDLLEKITPPIANGKDEWAEACMNVSKLVVEGLSKKVIKKHLNERGVDFNPQYGSLSLFEAALGEFYEDIPDQTIPAMKNAQAIRSKVKGHTSGSQAQELINNALRIHEDFHSHFQFMCDRIVGELERIDVMMNTNPADR